MKNVLKMMIVFFTMAGLHAQAQMSALAKDTAAVSFINNAAVGGMMEVAAGKMALQKGENAQVKTFAGKMIKDHTKANAELKKLALSKGYNQIPAKAKDSPMLEGTHGAAFDKHYIGMMLGDHKKTVALFEKASQELKDEQLKAFAVKTLPVLKTHLADVEKIAADMGVKDM